MIFVEENGEGRECGCGKLGLNERMMSHERISFMPEVYWYTLKRATSKPREQNEWSMPGELSEGEALKYFERETGFPLRQIKNEHEDGEFLLERRERLLYGTIVQPGAVLQTWWVARGSATK
ncbi:MAG: hypothetical protein WAV18_19360 [Roseiarcus sp.]